MPKLGEPLEPSHVETVDAWGRGVDTVAVKPKAETPLETTLPKATRWPID